MLRAQFGPALCAFTTIIKAFLQVYRRSVSRKRFMTPNIAQIHAQRTTSKDLSWHLCDSVSCAFDNAAWSYSKSNVQSASVARDSSVGGFPQQRFSRSFQTS